MAPNEAHIVKRPLGTWLGLMTLALILVPLAPSLAETTPPTATFANPTTLNGPMTVTFSEPVHSVSTANVGIRAEGTTVNVPATLLCRSAALSTVDCGTGPVSSALVTPSPALIPGQLYGSMVNPAEPTPLTDLDGNAAPYAASWFRGSLTEEETTPAAVYRWRTYYTASAYGGSWATEHLEGAYALYRFNGTSVTWYSVLGPGSGYAHVYIDGVLKGTYDNYSSTTRYHYGRTFSGLSNASHSIKVRVRGIRRAASTGTYVGVDAFAVNGVLDPTPAAGYRWRSVSTSGPSGGAYAVSDAGYANVSFTFHGPGIDWITMTGPDQGVADIYVDGVLKLTVDNYSASRTYGVARSLRNMDDVVHTMQIVVKAQRQAASSGKLVAIDRFIVRLVSIAMFRDLGAWVDLYDYSLDPATAVADLASHGVDTVYLQTARYSSSDDIVYPSDVGHWLEAAHAKGIKVVGWYLPAYSEYMATDVRRTIAIATYRSPAGHRFDALAVDIEYKGATSSLDEFNTGIVSHLDQVRAGVGTSYTIGAIVPSPVGMSLSPGSWAGFPWSAIGDRTHVVLPMAYWSYRTDCPSNPAHCPYQYAIDNVAQAKTLSGLPVHIIGGVGNDVIDTEVGEFADGVLAAHAYGGSLYDYRTTAAAFWPALEKLNQL